MTRTTRALLLQGGLLVLGAALVASVFLTSAPPSQSNDPVLVPDATTTPFDRISITREGKTVVVVRAPEGGSRLYRQEGGRSRPGEVATVDSLARHLAEPSIVRAVEGTQLAREKLGLGQPRVTIELEQPSRKLSIALGKPAPTPTGARYAELRVGDEAPRFVVLSAAAADAIDMAPEQLLDSRILPWLPSEIAEFTIDMGQTHLGVQRDRGKGRWYLVGAPVQRAARSRVEDLLVTLTTLRAKSFPDDTGIASRIDSSPLATITLVAFSSEDSPGKHRTKLRFGGTCASTDPGVYVSVDSPPFVACVKKDHLVALDTLQAPFTDDHLFTMHTDEVESLETRALGHQLLLSRRGVAFIQKKPSERDVSLGIGNHLLDGLTHLRGTLTTERCPAPPGEPPGWSRLTLRSGSLGTDDTVDEVLFTAPPDPDGSRRVCRADDQVVLRVAPSDASKLDVSADRLRDEPTEDDRDPADRLRDEPTEDDRDSANRLRDEPTEDNRDSETPRGGAPSPLGSSTAPAAGPPLETR